MPDALREDDDSGDQRRLNQLINTMRGDSVHAHVLYAIARTMSVSVVRVHNSHEDEQKGKGTQWVSCLVRLFHAAQSICGTKEIQHPTHEIGFELQ